MAPENVAPRSSDLIKKDEVRIISEETKLAAQNGIELYFAGKYTEAEEKFVSVIEADSQSLRAWFYIGLIYARTERIGSSEETFAISEDLPLVKFSDETVGVTPAQIIFMPRPAYTKFGKRNLIGGMVKLAVEFGADGKIAFVCPITKFDGGLTQMAIRAAWAIKFKPAVKDGKPISTVKSLLYTFGVD